MEARETDMRTTLVLPQVGVSAKRRLVKYSTSDNEANQKESYSAFSDNPSSYKKSKQNPTSETNFDSHNLRTEITVVAPSIVDNCKFRGMLILPTHNDLWESIRSNYIYLMDDDLIAACKKTQEELSWTDTETSSSSSCSPSWTCTQFIQRFNELHDRLHELQAAALVAPNKSHFLERVQTKLHKVSSECQVLKEQALLLEIRYPEMKDDIWRRCNILNNKWEALELSIYPRRQQAREGMLKKVSSQMKTIRRWLREVNNRLDGVNVDAGCTLEQMLQAYRNQQIVQQEIETRGKEVTLLVKQCSALESATVEAERVRRVAANLERSWHVTWLRSLETQCLTEQLLRNQGNSRPLRESPDHDLDEGPLTKLRRLTSDSHHRTADMTSFQNPATNHRQTPGDAADTGDRSSDDGDVIGATDIGCKGGTREIGILCSVPRDLVSVNDKCVMVGSTGIAALKAEYGDDFTNFEIIQDVGYSSESSTHLSSDDVNEYIRVYSYSPGKRSGGGNGGSGYGVTTDIVAKITEYSLLAASNRGFGHYSLGSSSSTSHNDSGFGHPDGVAAFDADIHEDGGEGYQSSLPGILSDGSEMALEDSIDFRLVSEVDEDRISSVNGGDESDEPLDTFQNRSSFTTSAQVFYKMTSLDSDNGDQEGSPEEKKERRVNEELDGGNGIPEEEDFDFAEKRKLCIQEQKRLSLEKESSFSRGEDGDVSLNKMFDAPSFEDEQESKNTQRTPESDLSCLSDFDGLYSHHPKGDEDRDLESEYSDGFRLHHHRHRRCSSPIQPHHQHHPWHQSKSRRRRLSSDVSDDTGKDNQDHQKISASSSGKNKVAQSTRVREWLQRCDSTPGSPRSLHPHYNRTTDDDSAGDHAVTMETSVDSSCDASGEYTTTTESDAELSSSSSDSADFGGGSVTLSRSGMGSVETVVPFDLESFGGHSSSRTMSVHEPLLLLSHPPPPTPPLSQRNNGKGKARSRLWSTMDLYSGHHHGNRLRPSPRSTSEGELNLLVSSVAGTKYSGHTPHRRAHLPRFIVPSVSSTGLSSDLSSSSTPIYSLQRNGLNCSLPSILRADSGHSSSDTSRSHRKSSSAVTSSFSWSSDAGRQKHLHPGTRRNRKRSSSSTQSIRSSLGGRHSIRQTGIVSNQRRRHLSQVQSPQTLKTSDGFADSDDRKWKATDDKVTSNQSETELDRTQILVSPENDVNLTQLEEQSTASDQVWDGYQDMPYLSEAYSEPTVDEDAVRKLTEFGDDYCSAIGGLSHRLDRTGPRTNGKLPAAQFTTISTAIPLKKSNGHVDSDSDIEDLHDILTETSRALQFARSTLNCRQDRSVLTPPEYAELLATCQTHLRCLQVICEYIQLDGKEKSFSQDDLTQLHDLIHEWEMLQKNTVMNHQQGEQSQCQKFLDAQHNINALFSKMSELSSLSHLTCQDFPNMEELEEKMEVLQMALSSLQETKEQLLAVNLQVHRIITESGTSASPLKDDITELYQQWEDAYEQNGSQLTELQLLHNRWQKYNESYQKLCSRVRERQQAQGDRWDNLLKADDENRVNLDGEFRELQMDAGFLESRLKGGMVWNTISNDLRKLEKQVKELRWKNYQGSRVQEIKQHAAKYYSVDSSQLALEEEEEEEFEDVQEEMEKSASTTDVDTMEPEKPPPSTASRFWRVLRTALPIQLALVFLYCLACALEPHCCDVLNNFNFSLSPQLRYVRGPPPV